MLQQRFCCNLKTIQSTPAKESKITHVIEGSMQKIIRIEFGNELLMSGDRKQGTHPDKQQVKMFESNNLTKFKVSQNYHLKFLIPNYSLV